MKSQQNPPSFLTYIIAWILMVVIAIGNGILRESVFAEHLNELQAHQISTVTIILFFGIYIWILLRVRRPESGSQALTIGLLWLGLTVVFEFLFGHFIMGHPWSRLFHDYNIFAGRLWIIVLIWISIAPYLIYHIQTEER